MESWKLHMILHLLIPAIVFILSILYIEDLSTLEKFLASFLGAITPDIDHLIYIKYIRFTSFKHFLTFNIKSDRYRRGFLLFHNMFFISVLALVVPILMFYNTFLSLFLLSFLIHLVFDFFEDRIIINVTQHWKFGK